MKVGHDTVGEAKVGETASSGTTVVTAVGNAAGSGDATGTRTLTHAAGGAAAGSADAVGGATVTQTVAGAAAGSGDAVGTGTVAVPAVGVAAGSGDAQGAATTAHTASGAVAGSADATGAGTLVHAVAGDLLGTGDATGAATVTDPDAVPIENVTELTLPWNEVTALSLPWNEVTELTVRPTMTHELDPVTMDVGESKTLDITVPDEDGSGDKDLSGGSPSWRLTAGQGDDTAVLDDSDAGVTVGFVTDGSDGRVEVRISRGTTDGMNGNYYHVVTVDDGDDGRQKAGGYFSIGDP